MWLLKAISPLFRRYNEQRRSPRENASFPAWISFGRGTDSLPCTVIDVSEHGARIELASPAGTPDDFYLLLTKNGSRQRRCRVVWRSGLQIGVIYMGHVEVLKIPDTATQIERSKKRGSSTSVEYGDLWMLF